MKRCAKCKETKQIENFPKNKIKKDGHHSYCKICCCKIMAKAYAANPKKYLDKIKASKNRLKEIVNKIKQEAGCYFCSENEPISLDFHHKDPSIKDDSINIVLKRKNEKSLMNEIKKCEVICSNCHRKLHAGLLSFK
jgi:L-lysine 2,3-aminomutase